MNILTYTQPEFKTICKNGSLKNGGILSTTIDDGQLKVKAEIFGKSKQEAESKLLKIIGTDAVLVQEERQ